MMSLRCLPVSTLVVLLASPAALAGTGFKMSLVPIPPACGVGSCLNGAGTCSVDADCNVGTLSPASTFQFTGKHRVLKVSISGATDASGKPLQTDGIPGTDDDYILALDANIRDSAEVLCPLSGCPDALVVAKVDFKKGKARVTVDLSSLLVTTGRTFRLRGGTLRLPPTHPADCPGDNSAAGLTMRIDATGDCTTGAALGMGGFVVGK